MSFSGSGLLPLIGTGRDLLAGYEADIIGNNGNML